MLSKLESSFHYKKEPLWMMVDITPSDEELRKKEEKERQHTSLLIRKMTESKNRTKKPLLKEHQEKG